MSLYVFCSYGLKEHNYNIIEITVLTKSRGISMAMLFLCKAKREFGRLALRPFDWRRFRYGDVLLLEYVLKSANRSGKVLLGLSYN